MCTRAERHAPQPRGHAPQPRGHAPQPQGHRAKNGGADEKNRFFFDFSSVPGKIYFDLLDLLNGAWSTPVSTTTVVDRDCFFCQWCDDLNFRGGVGVQSVMTTAPTRYVPFNACVLTMKGQFG